MCYQIPALAKHGIVLVVCPLIGECHLSYLIVHSLDCCILFLIYGCITSIGIELITSTFLVSFDGKGFALLNSLCFPYHQAIVYHKHTNSLILGKPSEGFEGKGHWSRISLLNSIIPCQGEGMFVCYCDSVLVYEFH